MTIPNKCTIMPSGKFGLLTPFDALEEYLHNIRNTESNVVILDLSHVSFMDSTGISWVVKAHKICKASGKYFAIMRPNNVTRELLTSLRLDNIIPIE